MLYLRRSYGSYLIKWDKMSVFLEIHYVIQRPEVYSLSITVWIWNLNSSTRLVYRLLGSRDEKNSKFLFDKGDEVGAECKGASIRGFKFEKPNLQPL